MDVLIEDIELFIRRNFTEIFIEILEDDFEERSILDIEKGNTCVGQSLEFRLNLLKFVAFLFNLIDDFDSQFVFLLVGSFFAEEIFIGDLFRKL